MKIALFRCCSTPIFLKQYESSTDAILRLLGVELVNIEGFNCCGYPIKSHNFAAYVLSSARNLALAERENLDIVTFCNCCYGSIRQAAHLMKEDTSMRKEINTILEKEGLRYDGSREVRHLLEVLYKDIGIDKIREHAVTTFKGLKIATHYGCHIMRPRQIVQLASPLGPAIFDRLVEITGAESIQWRAKVECCGSPMWGINDELSMDLAEKKIVAARQAGADYLCVACSYCQLQFDRVQKILLARRNINPGLPSILYTQLLGLSLGLDGDVLGIDENELDITGVFNFLA